LNNFDNIISEKDVLILADCASELYIGEYIKRKFKVGLNINDMSISKACDILQSDDVKYSFGDQKQGLLFVDIGSLHTDKKHAFLNNASEYSKLISSLGYYISKKNVICMNYCNPKIGGIGGTNDIIVNGGQRFLYSFSRVLAADVHKGVIVVKNRNGESGIKIVENVRHITRGYKLEKLLSDEDN